MGINRVSKFNRGAEAMRVLRLKCAPLPSRAGETVQTKKLFNFPVISKPIQKKILQNRRLTGMEFSILTEFLPPAVMQAHPAAQVHFRFASDLRIIRFAP